jgi:hypothetical protein
MTRHLLLLAGAIVLAWRVWRSLDWPLVHDAPLMHYIAWRIGEGAVPYRDVFDMNFPGVYLLHLLVVRGLGTSDLAWRLFDLGWLALSAVAIAAFARPWGRPAALAGALLFAFYHLAGGAWQSGQRDFLLCPFLLAGALGVVQWVESGRRAALLGGGLALGASMTLKPHTVVLIVALGVMVAGTGWRRDHRPAAPLGLFVAAAAVVPVAIVAWLAAVGALPAWRAIMVDYLLPLYSRLGRASSWNIYRAWLWIPLGAGAVLSLLTAWTVVRPRVNGQGLGGGAPRAPSQQAGRLGARHAVAGLGALYGLLHFVGQGKGWEYHLYPLAAFTMVLLAAGLEPGTDRAPRPLVLATLLAVIVSGIGLADKATVVGGARWEREKAARATDLAATLAKRLRPGDTVQVLDTTAGGVHALLRLAVRQPTRFLYDFHFFHDVDQPVIQGLRAELIRDLDASPPALIVVFEEGWPSGGYERLDAFPLLRERLARYDLFQTGPGYRIHAQRRRP